MSVLLTMTVFVGEELHSRVASAQPNRLFETTFGFKPDPQTHVLATHHRMGMDSATTTMEFRTTPAVIEKIVLCYNERTGIACFHWMGVD